MDQIFVISGIIAHIDHGKSTIGDSYWRRTNNNNRKRIPGPDTRTDMELERERGITIKANAIQMEYFHDGEKYILNLIDTPGQAAIDHDTRSKKLSTCPGVSIRLRIYFCSRHENISI